jgi:hypothetical protein
MSEKEAIIATEYALLPLIRRALEIYRKAFANSGLKFRSSYIAQLDEALHLVTDDMCKNKQEIFKYHIRMEKKNWLNYEVYVSGQLFDFAYPKYVAAD